jgi:hypothetical protein
MCRPFGLKGVSRVKGQRSATFDDRAAIPPMGNSDHGPACACTIDTYRCNSDGVFNPAEKPESRRVAYVRL